MPVILSDRGLFKCIHGNIVRNALKYGMPGGKVTTVAKYDDETGIFEMKIINLPGHNHDKLG
jgi:signal transduction histidine kinase